MLRFKAQKDIQMFLLEVGRADLLTTVTEESQIGEDLFESFIKGRRSLVPKLKDFRQSQNSKANWRKNRYRNLRGIRSFHKSTAGKRFHRALGRYLATRNPLKQKGEAVEGAFAIDLCEFLKAISSIKTHYWIERCYFHTLDEEIDLLILGDEIMPVLNRVEESAIRLRELESDDVDLLLALCHPNDLQLEFADIFNAPIEFVRSVCSETYRSTDMNEAGAYLSFLEKTKQRLCKV